VALWLHQRLSWPPAAAARLTGAPATLHDDGSSMSGRPTILFACRTNVGRSVTAKVLAEHYAASAVEVFSAGSEPGDAVHPEVASVLAGLGLSTAHEVPTGFDPNGRYDVVVTMGCGETCPVYLGARYEDWPLDDPKGQDEPTVRWIVADIDGRVRQLLASLVPDLPPRTSVLDDASTRSRS
jgi:arsenate reductase